MLVNEMLVNEMLVNGSVVCSVRKDQQHIAKAELCDIVVSLFQDKCLLIKIELDLSLNLNPAHQHEVLQYVLSM